MRLRAIEPHGGVDAIARDDDQVGNTREHRQRGNSDYRCWRRGAFTEAASRIDALNLGLGQRSIVEGNFINSAVKAPWALRMTTNQQRQGAGHDWTAHGRAAIEISVHIKLQCC